MRYPPLFSISAHGLEKSGLPSFPNDIAEHSDDEEVVDVLSAQEGVGVFDVKHSCWIKSRLWVSFSD